MSDDFSIALEELMTKTFCQKLTFWKVRKICTVQEALKVVNIEKGMESEQGST